MSNSAASYRESHKAKGVDYNARLSESAMDAYMARAERDFLHAFLPTLPREYYRRYLDFACGTGRITSVGEQYFPVSHGIDVSDSMLGEARKACRNTTFETKDLTRQPHHETYDLVTSFRFFGNAEPELRRGVLDALQGVLRPGGLLVVNNHRNPFALNRVAGYLTGGRRVMDLHHWRFKALAAEHGFRLVARRPVGAWIYRSALMTDAVLTSDRAARLERAFARSPLVPVAPDAIYVFRRV